MIKRNLRRALGAAVVAAGAFAALVVPAGAGANKPYFELDAVPAPSYTGKQVVADLEAFTEDFPVRPTGTPFEVLATDFLAADMRSLGYEVTTPQFKPATQVPVDPAASPIRGVVAVKKGTVKPDEYILFIGHYDSLPPSGLAVYDNGSGTNLLRGLARSFRNVPTNRSIMFAFYNGEEEGALASSAHAAALKAAGTKVTAVLGFDMVGIAWPVKTKTGEHCLCMWRGANDAKFDNLFKYVNYDFLGFPGGANEVEVRGANTRNSDESRFATQGFPTMRWAGMRTAGAYDQYHLPNDNMATITNDAHAGSREFFEKGMDNTLKSAYYTALALDNAMPVGNPSVAVAGATATATVDATDEDGPVGAISWDFGDGTPAVAGASATHTYAAPGTYTVTATLRDALWTDAETEITRTITVS